MKNLSFLFILTAAVFLSACSKPAPYQGAKDRLERMSKEERQELAPNELFMAVINGDLEKVKTISEESPQLLISRNAKNGDSPLGLAIEWREEESARELLTKIPQEEFFKGNAEGDSLIFQAARAGWGWMITDIADRYYNTLGNLNDYEFGDLDFKNHLGQRALFVARTGHIAEVLETQYYRGLMEWPFWQFTFLEDQQSKNFIHQAAQDSRLDVLRWAVGRFCPTNSWEKTPGWFFSSVGYVAERARRGFQTYVGGLGLSLDIKFNHQDLFGKTPLHYAAESLRLEALQVIASCQWVDSSLEDNQGNIPLQSLVLAMDPKVSHLPDSQVRALRFLLEQRPKMRSWFLQKADLVNHQNNEEETALHLAARLSDQRIYDLLSGIGDTEIKNSQGLSPREIFVSQKNKVKAYEN